MTNLIARFLTTIVSLAVLWDCGCSGGEPSYVAFSADSQWVVAQADQCVFHHTRGGQTRTIEGTIECRDKTGCHWVVKENTKDGKRWSLVELCTDGNIRLTEIPALPKGRAGLMGVGGFILGQANGKVIYATPMEDFFEWAPGCKGWRPSSPTTEQSDLIGKSLQWNGRKPFYPVSGCILMQREYASPGFSLESHGSTKVIHDESDDHNWVFEVVLHSPDAKTSATVKCRMHSRRRIYPPCCDDWKYTESSILIRDEVSGKDRTLWMRGTGTILIENVFNPTLEIICWPVLGPITLFTYVDA